MQVELFDGLGQVCKLLGPACLVQLEQVVRQNASHSVGKITVLAGFVLGPKRRAGGARRSKKRSPLRTALSRPALHRRSTLSWDQETGTGGRSLSLTLVATRFGAACLHKRARDEQGRLGILRSGAGAFRAPALSHAEVLLGFFERVVTQLDCLSPKA